MADFDTTGGKGSAYKVTPVDVTYPTGGEVGPIKGTKVVMRDNRQTLDKIEHEDPTYQETMNDEPATAAEDAVEDKAEGEN